MKKLKYSIFVIIYFTLIEIMANLLIKTNDLNHPKILAIDLIIINVVSIAAILISFKKLNWILKIIKMIKYSNVIFKNKINSLTNEQIAEIHNNMNQYMDNHKMEILNKELIKREMLSDKYNEIDMNRFLDYEIIGDKLVKFKINNNYIYIDSNSPFISCKVIKVCDIDHISITKRFGYTNVGFGKIYVTTIYYINKRTKIKSNSKRDLCKAFSDMGIQIKETEKQGRWAC